VADDDSAATSDQEAPAFPEPRDVQRLFEQLRISQTEDGCLRVEAPKETARTLAAVLESLGRLLRNGAD